MAEFLIRTILPVADALNNDQTAGWEIFGAPDCTGAAGAELCTDVRSWMSDTRSRRGSALLRQERTKAAGIFSRSRHRLDSAASHHHVLAAPSHACGRGGLGEMDTGQEETKDDGRMSGRGIQWHGENVTQELERNLHLLAFFFFYQRHLPFRLLCIYGNVYNYRL